jgi:protein TonB
VRYHDFSFRRRRATPDDFKGSILSVVFHLAMVILLVRATADTVSLIDGKNGLGTTGTGPNDGPAGGGGDGGEIISFVDVGGPPPVAAPPTPVEVVQPEEEVLVVKTEPVPEAKPTPEAVPQPTAPQPIGAPQDQVAVSDGDGTGAGSGAGASAGSGGGAGGGQGTGIGSGVGPGTGGGPGGIEEDVIAPPVPRGIFIPPSGRPASARGLEIEIWVFVRADGRVEPSNVRLEPPTDDARYNRRLIESASEWRFDPGKRNGTPTGAWYTFFAIL